MPTTTTKTWAQQQQAAGYKWLPLQPKQWCLYQQGMLACSGSWPTRAQARAAAQQMGLQATAAQVWGWQ